MLLLLHNTLKGSRNIQGFALVRAVLFILEPMNIGTYGNSLFIRYQKWWSEVEKYPT